MDESELMFASGVDMCEWCEPNPKLPKPLEEGLKDGLEWNDEIEWNEGVEWNEEWKDDDE